MTNTHDHAPGARPRAAELLFRAVQAAWPGALRLLRAIRRGAAAARRLVAECNRAQRRMLQLRLSPDRQLSDPNAAPDSYPEFLFRTSGPLQHEQPARKRFASLDSRR